jgi:hypothetical protein
LREYGIATMPRTSDTTVDSPALKKSSEAPMIPQVKPATASLFGGCCGCGGGACQ